MTEILLCSLIVSLVTSGFKIAAQKGMALHFIEKFLDKFWFKNRQEIEDWDGMVNPKEQPEPKVFWLYYPVLYCIKCMPSIYGAAICFLLLPFHVELLYQIPLVVFCSVTLNSIFYQLYE